MGKVMRINAVAPLVVAQAFADHVARSAEKRMVAISSSLGSIAETSGGYYAYRMSKAALNMAMATVAKDMAPRGITVQVFCPGWVQTEMGGANAPQTVDASVRGLRQLIHAAMIPGLATFQSFDGTPVPW